MQEGRVSNKMKDTIIGSMIIVGMTILICVIVLLLALAAEKHKDKRCTEACEKVKAEYLYRDHDSCLCMDEENYPLPLDM